jgi:hypothetical protein
VQLLVAVKESGLARHKQIINKIRDLGKLVSPPRRLPAHEARAYTPWATLYGALRALGLMQARMKARSTQLRPMP